MTLEEFVTARMAETERIATEAAYIPGRRWEAKSQGQGRENDGVLWDDDLANIIAWFDSHLPAAVHAALHDPRQVTREAEADRRLLAALTEENTGAGPEYKMGLRLALMFRAEAWCEHPDYDLAWKP